MIYLNLYRYKTMFDDSMGIYIYILFVYMCTLCMCFLCISIFVSSYISMSIVF